MRLYLIEYDGLKPDYTLSVAKETTIDRMYHIFAYDFYVFDVKMTIHSMIEL